MVDTPQPVNKIPSCGMGVGAADKTASATPAAGERDGVSSPKAAGAIGKVASAAKRGRHEAVKLPVSTIEVGERIRPATPERIARLAASIAEVGLRTPIIIRRVGRDRRLRLVAGAARLAAARQLGWQTIAATYFYGGEVEARLEEIDDNFRFKLTALEQGILLLERKRQYELAYPETVWGGDRRSEEFSKRQNGDLKDVLPYREATAQRLGLSMRTIERAVRRGQGITTAAQGELLGTALADVGADLDALTHLAAEEQLAAVYAAKRGGCGIREAIREMNAAARRTAGGEIIDLSQERMRREWRKWAGQSRIVFLDWLVTRGEATRISQPGEAAFTIRFPREASSNEGVAERG